MKTVIHVNQHNIKYNNNRVAEDHKPVLTCKTYKDNQYGFTAEVIGKDGTVVGVFKYRDAKPLSCGAKVWFETELEVRVSEDIS